MTSFFAVQRCIRILILELELAGSKVLYRSVGSFDSSIVLELSEQFYSCRTIITVLAVLPSKQELLELSCPKFKNSWKAVELKLPVPIGQPDLGCGYLVFSKCAHLTILNPDSHYLEVHVVVAAVSFTTNMTCVEIRKCASGLGV